MRDRLSQASFFAALDAWERHKKAYLAALESAKQPQPSEEQLRSYRTIWIEGYAERIEDEREQQS